MGSMMSAARSCSGEGVDLMGRVEMRVPPGAGEGTVAVLEPEVAEVEVWPPLAWVAPPLAWVLG